MQKTASSTYIDLPGELTQRGTSHLHVPSSSHSSPRSRLRLTAPRHRIRKRIAFKTKRNICSSSDNFKRVVITLKIWLEVPIPSDGKWSNCCESFCAREQLQKWETHLLCPDLECVLQYTYNIPQHHYFTTL